MLNLTLTKDVVTNLPTCELNSSFGNNIFSIVVTSNAIPKCLICHNVPNNPVTICHQKQLPINNRHLMCIECSKKYTEKACPSCGKTSSLEATNNSAIAEDDDNDPVFIVDKQADFFIQSMLESSLFVCSNSCGSLVPRKNLATHLLNCNPSSTDTSKKNYIATSKAKDIEPLKNYSYSPQGSGQSFIIPMTDTIHAKYSEDHKTKYSFGVYETFFTRKQKLNDIQMIVFEMRINKTKINCEDLIASNLILRLDDKNKIKIEITKCDHGRFNDINNATGNYSLPNTVLRDNFIEHVKGANYQWHPIGKYTIYSIAIYPLIFANPPFVYFFEFHPSEIDTLMHMYTENKPNTPTSFINLIEFFSEKGLHTEYTKIYSENMGWQIRIAERELSP